MRPDQTQQVQTKRSGCRPNASGVGRLWEAASARPPGSGGVPSGLASSPGSTELPRAARRTPRRCGAGAQRPGVRRVGGGRSGQCGGTDGGRASPMAAMSSPYPYERSRSASSMTSVCRLSRICTPSPPPPLEPPALPAPRRSSASSCDGVAIRMSGMACGCSAAASAALASDASRTPPAPACPRSCRSTPCTCWQSSRVGTSTTPPTPAASGAAPASPSFCASTFCSSGMLYAYVLPVPVGARASTSLPCSTSGMHRAWVLKRSGICQAQQGRRRWRRLARAPEAVAGIPAAGPRPSCLWQSGGR